MYILFLYISISIDLYFFCTTILIYLIQQTFLHIHTDELFNTLKKNQIVVCFLKYCASIHI